jgi:acyl carrier protein
VLQEVTAFLGEYNVNVTKVDTAAICRDLEEVLDLSPGALQGGKALSEAWDSIATMGFVALADRKYGATIPAKRIPKVPTIQDLTALIHEFAN